jgi:hypothetical protein
LYNYNHLWHFKCIWFGMKSKIHTLVLLLTVLSALTMIFMDTSISTKLAAVVLTLSGGLILLSGVESLLSPAQSWMSESLSAKKASQPNPEDSLRKVA